MIYTLQILALIVAAPLLQGGLRRLRARLQNKPGPSVLQPYRDLRKLWYREAVLPRHSLILLAAPGVALGVALAFAAMVPVKNGASWSVDAVALALLLALGRFILVLAALDTRSAFEGMAAGREIAFATLTEAPLILALLAAGNDALIGALSAGALLLVMLLETARVPVDNQATHYELTMIHEGLLLEFSGWQLAMLHYAAYLRQAVFFVLLAVLLPGTGLMEAVWIGAAIILVSCIETAYAKLRLFEVPQLFASALVLSIASIGLRMAQALH